MSGLRGIGKMEVMLLDGHVYRDKGGEMSGKNSGYVCQMPRQAAITEEMWGEIVGFYREQGKTVTANQVKDLFPEQWEVVEEVGKRKMYKHKAGTLRR